MTVDPIAQALHHKSVLGGVLTPEEQERLRQWYAKMDEEEAAMFANAREREGPDSTLAAMDTALESIAAAAKRIRALEVEIDRKRGEIAALERELGQKKIPQSA